MSKLNPLTNLVGSVMILTLFLALTSCSEEKNGDASGNNGGQVDQNIPAVEAVQARFGSLPLVERLSGTVKAPNLVEKVKVSELNRLRKMKQPDGAANTTE